jgi:nucleotide-binding universal stress UspA family protein
MYQRILVPTDGSALSKQAVAGAVRLARATGAQVLGMHVIPLLHDDQLEAWLHHDPQLVARRQALFDRFADDYLAVIEQAAQQAEVPCTVAKVRSPEAASAILKTAGEAGCDLIYMASHGWRKDQRQMLGSETLKVLHNSPVPVLVHMPGGPM